MRSDIAYGDGMYKSTDGGKSWTHIGLTDTKQIGAIVVDPQNADVVYVAALGHPYGCKRRARRLQNDRWRKDVEQSPLQGCRHRRDLAGNGAGKSERYLCRTLADAPSALERLSALERPGQRALQNDRRRRDVDAAHERPAYARRSHRASRFRRRRRAAFTPTSTALPVKAASIVPTMPVSLGRTSTLQQRIWQRGWYFMRHHCRSA